PAPRDPRGALRTIRKPCRCEARLPWPAPMPCCCPRPRRYLHSRDDGPHPRDGVRRTRPRPVPFRVVSSSLHPAILSASPCNDLLESGVLPVVHGRAGLALALTLFLAGLLADAPPQPPAGFTPLFNGRDLSGWRGRQ